MYLDARAASIRGGLADKQVALDLTVLVMLAAATCYEASVAFGAISMGSVGGEGPTGEGVVLASAFLALLVGAVLSLTRAVRTPARAGWLTLLAPAAAAFLTARFYTFDSYYLPTLRRMSDGGVIAPGWVHTLIGMALFTAVLTRVSPRFGLVISVPVVLVCALTALIAGTGH